MIFLSFLLLTLNTLLLNTCFSYRSRLNFGLSLLILGYANLVVTLEVASLLSQITPVFVIGFQIFVLVGLGVVWYQLGQPHLLIPFQNGQWKIWTEVPKIKKQPPLLVLLIGVAVIYVLGAILIISLPQNTFDSMTYHLSRVGYWLQHETLFPWDTPNPRQTTFPINAELGILWTVLFSKSDRFAGFVQWFSAVGIGLTIFGLARLMKFTRSQGLFAALIWATFPQIALQSITTQNDLVVAFFIVAAVYFLFWGVKTGEQGALLISGLAVGLAVGTKVTVALIVPGFLLTIGLLWILNRSFRNQNLIRWVGYVLIGIIILGSFTYIQNQIFYGNPLGLKRWTGWVLSGGVSISRLQRMGLNLLIYAYQFLDLAGLPEPIFGIVNEFKASLAELLLQNFDRTMLFSKIYALDRVMRPSNIIQEDTVWFGALAPVLLIAGIGVNFWQGLRQKDLVRFSLILIGGSFLFVISFLFGWTPFRVRYFVIMISVLAPLMGVCYLAKPTQRIYMWFVTVISLWILSWAFINNISHPLIGSESIIGQTRSEIRLRNNPKMINPATLVADHVPEDAVLLTSLGLDHWDYVLFGDNFERQVIPLDPQDLAVDAADIQAAGAEYFLVAPRERLFLEIPAGLSWIAGGDGWDLYRVGGEVSDQPVHLRERIAGVQDEQNILNVSPALWETVGVTELYAQDWGIESHANQGFKWLGEGLNQGLRGFLYSVTDIPVLIRFRVQPGPSNMGVTRNLVAGFYRYGPYGPILENALRKEITISDLETNEIIYPLKPGLNEFRFYSLDRATAPASVTGDQRPLLLRLDQIEILPFENNPGILQVAENLQPHIEVTEKFLAEWDVEVSATETFYWLGTGIDQGYEAFIWVDQSHDAQLQFKMQPGPARDDPTRNVAISWGSYPGDLGVLEYSKVIQFDNPVEYEIELRLQPGLNSVALAVLDDANVPIHANGDTRPLLVQLKRIDLLTDYE